MKVVAVFVICLITCLASSNVWEVVTQSKASSKSRFYVLHDWPTGDGLYLDKSVDAFPAYRVSDIMLKTMGILREGVSWSGVHLGNLFKRPKATALFVINGLSDEVEIGSLSQKSFPVEQSSLTGQIANDAEIMFSGDNVMQHIDNLFDNKPIAQFISGNKELSSMLSPELSSLSTEQSTEDELNRIAIDNNFNGDCEVAKNFISELLSIQSSVEKLSSNPAVTDRVPDVYVFSFTTLKVLQTKYGPFSDELQTAMEMLKNTVKQVNDNLVKLYNGDIVVQALVMQWEYRTLNKGQIELIRSVLDDYMEDTAEVDSILAGLPTITLPNMDSYTRSSVCEQLVATFELEDVEIKAECTEGRSFIKRSAGYSYLEDQQNITYTTPGGIVEKRTDEYPAIFLIIFVTVVPLALALFAISWAMWNIDPGRDSIIYRNTDNIPGLNN